MTLTARTLLLLVAVVLFVLAALGVDSPIGLLALGLAAFAGAFLVPDRVLSRR